VFSRALKLSGGSWQMSVPRFGPYGVGTGQQLAVDGLKQEWIDRIELDTALGLCTAASSTQLEEVPLELL